MGKSSSQLSRRPRELKNNDEENSNKSKRNKATMEVEKGEVTEDQKRIPLAEVVSDCVERWFQDTLKEAKAGDVNMQVLVSQMYNNGYGVPKDANKGKFWMTRVSRVRSSVSKVSKKRPGYNASDSDSDELEGGS